MSMLNSQTKWGRNVELIKIIFDNCVRLAVLAERNVLLKLYNTEYSRYIYFFHFSEANIRLGVEAESWIMKHSNKTCKNHEFWF